MGKLCYVTDHHPRSAISLLPLPSIQVSKEKIGSTDKIAAKGSRVGETKVTVSILDPQYNHVPPETVPFYVLDHFVLDPATILRIMPGSTVQYTLKKLVNQTILGLFGNDVLMR
jgi:hypothetical protein